jgi:all-trans-retinol 13,14-reductase
MSPDKKYDIAIIGGGLAGLGCGSILAQNGLSVAVIEQHSQPGGCLQTFRRKGLVFDTGMHYVGGLDKGQILHRLFNTFGIADNIEAQRLDTAGFDIINIAGTEYPYPMGLDNFRSKLSSIFPAEKEAISTYVQTIEKVSASVLEYSEQDSSSMAGNWNPAIETNAYQYICGLTPNTRLRELLAGLNTLYAGSRATSSLYTHSVINRFFIDSAWRLPRGGQQIAEELCRVIKQHGGDIMLRSKVSEIQVSGKTATKAILACGKGIEAGSFISTLHPRTTIELTSPGSFRKSFINRINDIPNTISCFCLYMALKPGSIKHRNSNYYYNSGQSVWAADDYDINLWPQGYMIYTTESPLHPGWAESATAITPMQYHEMGQWENTFIGRRGAGYEAMKAGKAAKLMHLIDNTFEPISRFAEWHGAATPLSYRDYTGTPEGSMYGIDRSCADPLKTFLLPNTSIKNLYLSGQSTNLHGAMGVSMGAVITSCAVLGSDTIMKDIKTGR